MILVEKGGGGMIKFRRRNYLVNKKLQLEFSWLLMLQTAVPIVILGGSLYIVNKLYLLALQRIVGITAITDADVQGILNFSIMAMIVLLITVSMLLLLIGIMFSHHIAGPLYKIEDSLDRILRGEKIEPLKFRKSDAVNGLSEKFNALIRKINQIKE